MGRPYDRLTLCNDGALVEHHPQAQSKIAREQGYIVARVEKWAHEDYGRLFAAAPALLEACRAIHRDGLNDGTQQTLSAALARVEG